MTAKVGDKYAASGSASFKVLEIKVVHGPRVAVIGVNWDGDSVLATMATASLSAFYEKVEPFFEVGKGYKFPYGLTVYTVVSLHEGKDGKQYALADADYSDGSKSMTMLGEGDFKDMVEA